MRIEGWHSQEIFGALLEKAENGANNAMDGIIDQAKQRLAGAVVEIPPIVRAGSFGTARVSFTPKTGKNKGQLVDFTTDKRWSGRRTSARDQLYESLRRSNKPGSGSVRGYCGNFLAYWAFMVEKSGYTDRGGKFHPPLHFLQGSFHTAKNTIVSTIAKG